LSFFELLVDEAILIDLRTQKQKNFLYALAYLQQFSMKNAALIGVARFNELRHPNIVISLQFFDGILSIVL
jgi:hypothetical protein